MKTRLLKTTVLPEILLAVLLLVMSLLLPSCEEEKKDDPAPGSRSDVPGPLVGQWTAGNFSMSEFWDYNGTYTGNAFELGIAFDFKRNGDCAFFLVTGGTSYSCRTEAFVYKKGTAVFCDNDSFTFYPAEGNNRGFYKGCGSSYKNHNTKAEKKDLKPETYYYSLEKNSNGKNQLIIRLKPSEANGTSFYPATW